MDTVKRSSNIELLRIVAMLMIVLHHYCVNSGLTEVMVWNDITPNMVLVQFMSIGGKVGVNIFFLISGYFMINKVPKLKKVVKLLFEILFYNIIVFLFLHLLGVEYTKSDLLNCFVPILFSTNTFIATYLFVYVLSPMINKGVKSLSCKEFRILLIVLLTFYSILGTFFLQYTWHYFGWGVTMYCVGAYIRLYGLNVSRKMAGVGIVACVVFIWGFQLMCDFGAQYVLGERLWSKWMFMLTDANKLPVFAMAVFMFVWFNKSEMGHSKWVNTMAASCFGVLMIHANCWPMRHWLWGMVLDNVGFYSSAYLWLHMILATLGVYLICTLIDMLRIKYIENPLSSRILEK